MPPRVTFFFVPGGADLTTGDRRDWVPVRRSRTGENNLATALAVKASSPPMFRSEIGRGRSTETWPDQQHVRVIHIRAGTRLGLSVRQGRRLKVWMA